MFNNNNHPTISANPPTPPAEEEEEEEGAENTSGGGDSDKAQQKEVTPLKEITSSMTIKPAATDVVENKSKKDDKKQKGSVNPNWPPMFKKVEITESQKVGFSNIS